MASLGLINGVSIQGVQKKLSASLSKSKDNNRLTLTYGSDYILKSGEEGLKEIVELEQVTMSMAEASNISVVPHGLLPINENNLKEGYFYITKRIDKDFKTNKKYPMEDFLSDLK